MHSEPLKAPEKCCSQAASNPKSPPLCKSHSLSEAMVNAEPWPWSHHGRYACFEALVPLQVLLGECSVVFFLLSSLFPGLPEHVCFWGGRWHRVYLSRVYNLGPQSGLVWALSCDPAAVQMMQAQPWSVW